MATFTSHSPAETAALGEAWGRAAAPGLVIGLCGELGAGKTELVKGLARGLAVPQRVHSPTFALVNVYTGGRLALFHLDLYRLETREQIYAAGLEEYLHPPGVTVIEWAERWFGGGRAENEGGLRARGEAGSSPPDHARWSSDLENTVAGLSAEIADHRAPGATHSGHLRWVQIETTSPTERHIAYEDFGA